MNGVGVGEEKKLWPPLRTTIAFDEDTMGGVVVLEHYAELPPGISADFEAALKPVVELARKHHLRTIVGGNAYHVRDMLEALATVETMRRARGHARLEALGFEEEEEDDFDHPPLPRSVP